MIHPLLELVRGPFKLSLFVLSDYDLVLLLHVTPHGIHCEHLLAQKTPCLDGLPHVVAELHLLHIVVVHVTLHHPPLHH